MDEYGSFKKQCPCHGSCGKENKKIKSLNIKEFEKGSSRLNRRVQVHIFGRCVFFSTFWKKRHIIQYAMKEMRPQFCLFT